jgi:enamine deaminase RidA (YjgF/YER057c/UK114 family)
MRAVRFDWYARSPAEPRWKRMTDIERWQGDARGRSRATAWRDLVFTVATAPGPTVAEQTRASLAQISANLLEAGTDHTRLLSATVYLTDIANKAQMDAEWCDWTGDSANWPQRACVQAELAPGALVEITVVAARPRLSVR